MSLRLMRWLLRDTIVAMIMMYNLSVGTAIREDKTACRGPKMLSERILKNCWCGIVID